MMRSLNCREDTSQNFRTEEFGGQEADDTSTSYGLSSPVMRHRAACASTTPFVAGRLPPDLRNGASDIGFPEARPAKAGGPPWSAKTYI
jgi:hypothetical protein